MSELKPLRSATFLLLLALGGCAALPERQSAPSTGVDVAEGAPDQTLAPATIEPAPVPDTARPKQIEREFGSGAFVSTTELPREPLRPAREGEVMLDFVNSPLPEVVRAILGNLLEQSYTIAPGVGGTVTFSTAKAVSKEQAFAILEMLLGWNNASLVFANGQYRIVPTALAVPGNLVPRSSRGESMRGFEVRAFPLSYIAPTEMEKLLQPFLRPGALLRSDNARAMMLLAGTQQELENYAQTIAMFDIDWLDGMSVTLFRLEQVEAAKVVPELQAVFGDQSGTPLAGMFRFVPIERLNAVLVITPQPEYLEKAEDWLRRLDRGGETAGVRLYVYDVRNVEAKNLAEQLTDIFGGGGGRKSSAVPAASGGVAPGLQPVEMSTLNQPVEGGQPALAAPSAPTDGSGLAITTSEDIKITAVEENNQLLVRATAGQYEAILGAIKRLDIIPLQVHVEVKVIEVTLNDSLRYGVQWFLEGLINGGEGDGARTPLGLGGQNQEGSLSSTGLFYRYVGPNGAPELEGILTALQNVSTVRILSAPSMVVLNNKEASINVGQQIPITTTFFNPVSGGVGQNTQSSVQYLQTGITLNVKPRVNPGGLVFMEVAQEVSSPSGDVQPNVNPPVSQRKIESEIAVQSGETVLLGGLIQDQNTIGRNGVPGLSQIPILGGLFGSQSNSTTRQELLVLITPTVVRDADEARTLTEEFRRQLRGVEPLTPSSKAPQ